MKIFQTILDLFDDKQDIPQIIQAGKMSSLEVQPEIVQEAFEESNLYDANLQKTMALEAPGFPTDNGEIEVASEDFSAHPEGSEKDN